MMLSMLLADHCPLVYSWFQPSACYSVYTGRPYFLSLLLLLCVSLPDSVAAVLSGTVLVIEDMLTSGDQYLLPDRSICLEAVCVFVYVHAHCVYGHVCAHIHWCMSKMFGTRDRHMRVLLSFISLCPWGCQLSLDGDAGAFVCVCVHVRVRVGFRYQFMGDYIDSFHSYFSLWIFYRHINKMQFQGSCAHGRDRGAERSCGSAPSVLPSTEIIGQD